MELTLCIACNTTRVPGSGMKCLPCADAAVAAIAPRLRAAAQRDIEKLQARVDAQNRKAYQERMKRKRGPITRQPIDLPFTPAGPHDEPLRCLHGTAPTGACLICHPRGVR